MMLKLGMMAALAVLVLAVAPAFAEVKTLELAKTSYDADEKLAFTGTVASGDRDDIVIQITKESTTKALKNSMIQAKPGSDGSFTTQSTPKTAEGIFKQREGIYNVTVTAGGDGNRQNKVTMLQIQYEDGKVTKYTPPVPKLILQLEDKRVAVGDAAIVPISLAAGSEQGATYKIAKRPSHTDLAVITSDGKFLWQPTKIHASDRDNPYVFTIQAKKGSLVTTETLTITVKKAYDSPIPVAQPAPKPVQIAFTVDSDKDPQSYVDRYTNEPSYKKWFEKNYPQYSSIYEAVGLEEPKQLASFVKADVDPQKYVDRYNTEPPYKKWFDKTYPEYSSIYEAVGLEEPKPLASFVKADVDPQKYVDRYNTEPPYKKWFDKTFPQYVSIYEAVGLKEISAEPEEETRSYGSCGAGTMLVDEECVIPAEKQYGYCGTGTTLVDEECIIGAGTVEEKPWWQFW